MASKQDAELIDTYRRGDKRAGERLFERYYAKVLGFCRSKAPSAATDIAQRSFLACFEGLDTLRDPGAFRSFLFAIVCNEIRMHYRRDQREGTHLDFTSASSIDLDPSPSQIVGKQAEHRLLLEGLRRVPLEYQMALELFYWEDMRAADIAEVLGIPLGTAKTRLRRGRQLLEQALASLESAGAVLESTVSNLESWAKGLRPELGPEPS